MKPWGGCDREAVGAVLGRAAADLRFLADHADRLRLPGARAGRPVLALTRRRVPERALAAAAGRGGHRRAAISGCSLTFSKPQNTAGVYRVDGTPMREAEWRRFWDAERPVGRRVHLCRRERAA